MLARVPFTAQHIMLIPSSGFVSRPSEEFARVATDAQGTRRCWRAMSRYAHILLAGPWGGPAPTMSKTIFQTAWHATTMVSLVHVSPPVSRKPTNIRSRRHRLRAVLRVRLVMRVDQVDPAIRLVALVSAACPPQPPWGHLLHWNVLCKAFLICCLVSR